MKIYFLLMLCVLFWSGNFILGRYIRLDLDPIQLSFFRWLGVLVILLPSIFMKYKEFIKTLKNHFLYMLTVSFLGIACFNTFLYIGLKDTTATNALLINSSIPILIIIFSILILKINISKIQIIGILFSMLGVVFLALQGKISNLFTLNFNKGDIWIIASSISWALYSVLVKSKPKNINAFFPITVFLGTIMIFFPFSYEDYSILNILDISLEAKLTILYTIILPSIVSFHLWHIGIEKIGADKTGQFTHLMPIFGIFLAFIFLDEKLYFYQFTGFILVALGIYLSLFLTKKE